MKNRLLDNSQMLTDEESDKWIEIAFPAVTVAIIVSILLPNLIVELREYFNIIFPKLLKITISAVTVQILLIVPVMIIALIISQKIKLRDKFRIINWKNDFIKQALVYELFLFLPLIIISAIMFYIATNLGIDTSSPIKAILDNSGFYGKLIIFVVAVFIAPIVEEIVFRRIVFTFIYNLFGITPALIIASFVFAVLHGGIVQLVPLFILGSALQILYIKNNSLFPSILLHFFHNFIILSLFFIAG